MFSALKKAALTLLNLADGLSTDLYASERGALWVASDNQVAQGVELLTVADRTFTAPGIREIRITGAGNLKIEATNLSGVQADITIPVTDGDRVSCQWITKLYASGTTATGLVGYK